MSFARFPKTFSLITFSTANHSYHICVHCTRVPMYKSYVDGAKDVLIGPLSVSRDAQNIAFV